MVKKMIKLTTLKGNEFYLNCELIEKIEEIPDTMITLLGGKKIWVKERAETVVEKTVQYKRKLYSFPKEVE